MGKGLLSLTKIRSYIKNRCILGIQAKDIFNEICRVYGNNELSFSSVTRWCKKFKIGVNLVEDAPHARRPKTATSQKIVEKVTNLVATDAGFTTRHIAKCVGISLGAAHTILRRDLKMRRIIARWMPNLVSKEQKLARVRIAKQLLKQLPKYNNRSFANIITGDETWVHFYEPKRKIQNKIWATKGGKRPCIAKRTMNIKKVMYVIFFANQGPAIQIALPKGKSVNARFYKGNVLHKVKKHFLSRRPATGLRRIRLLHDNASSHKAAIVRKYLKLGKVVELTHPPYSPDLAPCDSRLKKHLAGRKYQTRQNLGSAIFQCLNSIPRKDYENAFKIGLKD